MIKLIVTDIDGTLVKDTDVNINNRYFDVIKKLTDKDIKVMVASGRIFNGINALFLPISNDIIINAMNGAYISYKNKDLFISNIHSSYVKSIIEIVNKIDGLEILLSDQKTDYTNSKDEDYIDLLVNKYESNLKIVDNLLELDYEKIKIVKITLYTTKLDTLKESQIFKEKFNDELNIVVSGKNWIDIMNKNISKGEAIKIIQDIYGITKEETVCFGDQENDLSMFDVSGISFAVSNAIDDVKSKSNYVIGSYKEDAVLGVLEKILKDGKYE